jgi:hypothetical protein
MDHPFFRRPGGGPRAHDGSEERDRIGRWTAGDEVEEGIVRQLKGEASALVGSFAAVLIGALAFVTLTMPFVFPIAAVAAISLVWRYQARLNAVPRGSAPGSSPGARSAGRRSPRLYAV